MRPRPIPAGEVTLRTWEPAEGDVYDGLRDELVWCFTTEQESAGAVECGARIATALENPNHVPFAICGPEGRPVGNMSLVRRGDTAEISYWLGPEARGRGWASDALRTATEWAFGNWAVERAELEIDAENVASQRVAEAAGYRRRGARLTSACGGPAVVYVQTPHD